MGRPRRGKTVFIILASVLLIGMLIMSPGCSGGRKQRNVSVPETPAPGKSTPGASPSLEGTLSVFVSILPQAYFVERIGAERATVEVMVKPGQDPHTFEPTPQQMARLARADVFFRIGVEFENTLIPRIRSTMKKLVVVDCRKDIRLRQMEAPGHNDEEQKTGQEHSAGEHGEGEREGTDPHIWLSVRNAIRISGTMHDALVRLDPEGKEIYDRGYRKLVDDLEALDRRISAILEPVKGESFFVFHPSFGYFADEYGLKQVAVETGGTEPSARQLARLIGEAERMGVRVLFMQPQFSRKSAETIASEIGAKVVPIDPLAWDYIDNLGKIARAIEEGLK
jgi:zinc transport system substrate-binding protein